MLFMRAIYKTMHLNVQFECIYFFLGEYLLRQINESLESRKYMYLKSHMNQDEAKEQKPF